MYNQKMVLVQKRLVDFATLATGTSENIILADLIDVIQWREMTLLVDVHSHSLASGAGSIGIFAYARSWTAEDPGLDFATSVSNVSITSATPNPGVLSVAVPSILMAPMMRIVASGSRAAGGAYNATVSVYLSTKNA